MRGVRYASPVLPHFYNFNTSSGTGKTVMILGLILATVDQLPAPEESILDPRPVMTPLAFRHFPSSPFTQARQRLERGKQKRKDERAPRIPSLTETLIHYCRVNPEVMSSRPRKENFPVNHLWPAYRRNVPFYYHYEDEPFEAMRPNRNKREVGPKTMYLTTATLVIVPPNLLNQWSSEINKHCDENVSVFRATERSGLPPAQKLATSYDVSAHVLLLSMRFH